MLDRKNLYRVTMTAQLLVGASVLVAAPAGAQDAAAIQTLPQALTTEDTAEDAADEADSFLVVTGTRLRSGFTSPTPVTMLGVEQLEQRGATNVADLLNELPAFNRDLTPTSTGKSTGNSGANYLNLRDLGANRSLVLIDNKRILPSFTSSNQVGVNINLVPAIAIERVDVVTGGASAAYGSDAVAGVVNFMFNRRFSGIKTDVQFGISQYGDGERYRAAFIAGSSFAGERGHVMIAADFARNEGIGDQCDRDWGCEGWMRYPNPSNTGPNDGRPAQITRPDARLANATYGGLIISPGAVRDIEFGPDGTIRTFQPGVDRGPAFTSGGSGAAAYQDLTLEAKVRRRSLLATVDYELSDNFRVFADFLYGQARGIVPMHPQQNLGNITIRSDNAFLPEEVRQIMTANNIASFMMGRLSRDLGYVTGDVRSRTYRATAGFEWRLGGSWTLEAYGAFSDDSTQTHVLNNRILANFELAVDAVRDPQGNIVCRSQLNLNAIPAPLRPTAANCVPLNLFGEGSPSQAAIDYINATGLYVSNGTQKVASATFSGELFRLMGRPMSVAFGGEYRGEAVDAQVDEISARSGFLVGNNLPFRGNTNVKEAFIEAALPLAFDWPLVQSLELNGAYRLTDYSLSGTVSTWKAGVVWDVWSDLRIRGTLSRDIRAPNLRELFGGPTLQNFVARDPCDAVQLAGNANARANCAALGLSPDFRQTVGNVQSLGGGGNPNLGVEKADTLTAGVVLTPSFVRGLRLSVDYYNIEINEAISTIGNQLTLEICYERFSTPGPTCGNILRNSEGQLIRVENSRFNIASSVTRGIDAEVSYTTSAPAIVSGAGQLSARLLGTYVLKDTSSTDGIVFIDAAGQRGGNPHFKGTFTFTWKDDRLSISPVAQYIGPLKFDNRWGPEDIDDNRIKDVVFFNVTANYALNDARSLEVYGGIDNILNTDPPRSPETSFLPYSTEMAQYPVIGRFFFLGARARF